MKDAMAIVAVLLLPFTLGTLSIRIAMNWAYDVVLPVRRAIVLAVLVQLVEGLIIGFSRLLDSAFDMRPWGTWVGFVVAMVLAGCIISIRTEASLTGGTAVAVLSAVMQGVFLLVVLLLAVTIQHFAGL